MRRLLAPLLAAALALVLAAPAQAQFGLHDFEVSFREADGSPAEGAGSHPFEMETSFFANTTIKAGEEVPVEPIKDVIVSQLEGLAINPSAVESCSTLDFLDKEVKGGASVPRCAAGSAVGVITVYNVPLSKNTHITAPVYLVDAAPGAAARLGFWVVGVPVTIDGLLSESPPYEAVGASRNISQILNFYGAEFTLWGTPADSRHDEERGDCVLIGGSCSAEGAKIPFLTMPRTCGGPLATRWAIDPWTRPGEFVFGSAPTPAMVACDRLSFGPTIAAQPTSHAAQSPSGLDFALDVEDEGLLNPNDGALASSDIEKTVVTFPRGMSINPSQAEGLAVCSEAQLDAESAFSASGEGCPEASKIGTIEIETPLLVGHVLHGSLYVAEPYANRAEDSLIAVYIVIKDPDLGVSITQPIKVEPDPASGRLIATAEDIPQQPFSHFRLHFREGARSPLITPPGCGRFEVGAKLYPWAGGEPVDSSSEFEIVTGPGGACPSGTPPFKPGFEAGTLNNAAKSFSPFYMRLTRADAEQDMTRFSATLPPGVAGILAGLSHCPDSSIATARARTGPHGGREERDDPSCPQSSRIGSTIAGAGVGSQLTYVGGSLYLAGPYNGAPLSVVSITPALAGPFDAGTVVVRVGLALDPKTGQVKADASASDQIPHILKGIPLNVRDLRVRADRQHFTFNATSCAEERARATLWGGGTSLLPLPDSPVELSTRYQAAGCSRLGFKPKLAITLRGGTSRGAHPALRAIVKPRPNDANFAGAAVTLPHSAFLDQAHIRTICTRVQFAAGEGNGERCPKGSIYGRAKAWTPILEKPATGPVFLRSSNHNLPDLVIALKGPPEAAANVEISARIDSERGGIRSTFTGIPDLPVSRFVLEMRGGKRGLIVNSTNLCNAKHRASADITGQNGRLARLAPEVRPTSCKKRGSRKARR